MINYFENYYFKRVIRSLFNHNIEKKFNCNINLKKKQTIILFYYYYNNMYRIQVYCEILHLI